MKQQDHQTRERLLVIARDHFARYGYSGTNLEQIGRQAGVSRGPLYYYFKNKKELYLAVMQEEMVRLRAQYLAIFEGEDPIDVKLRKDIVFCSSHESLLRQAGLGGKSEPVVSEIHELYEQIYQLKKQACIQAQQRHELRMDADPDEMVELLYIYVFGLNEVKRNAFSFISKHPLEQYADQFVDLFLTRYGTPKLP